MKMIMKICRITILFIIGVVLCFFPISVSAVIPVDDLTVIDNIPTDETTTRIALSPDRSTLYAVQRSKEAGINVQGTVFVVSTNNNAILDQIPLGIGFPFQMAITPDGTTGYLAVSRKAGAITSNGPNRVDVIDTETNAITTTIPIGGSNYGPTGVAITPDGNRVYVTNRGSARVEVIDTQNNTFVKSIAVGSGPVGIATTPDGTRAYVANRRVSTSTVIDTVSETVTATIPVVIGPSSSATSVAITPDGNRAYITYFTGSRIAVIDIDPLSSTFNQQTAIITTTGDILKEITTVPDGTLAFVCSKNTGEMLVIDTDPSSPTFHTQIGAVPVGTSPFGVAGQDLSTTVAYVSIEDAVQVIGLETIPVIIDIKPGSDPNCFNNDGHGVIPVAILGSLDFDVNAIDANTVVLYGMGVKEVGKGNKLLAHIEDVNADGYDDLLVQIQDSDGVFQQEYTVAVLTGNLFDGASFQGSDSICIVP